MGDTGWQEQPPSCMGCPPGVGNLVGVGESSPVFYQKHPTHPPTYHLLSPEMGEHSLLSICCSWGRFSRCCWRPQCRGHEVPAQTGTTCGAGVQSLTNRGSRALARHLSNLASQTPKTPPYPPFVYSFSRSWSTLFLGQEHSAAPHCRPDSDFSDCHFLCFPAPPHSSFPATPPSTQVTPHTPFP